MVGVAPHVIRNWAARGHIQPVRADGNRTIYDAEEVAKVAARLGHLPELREPADGICCDPECYAAVWEQAPVPLCLEHTMAIWTAVNEAMRKRMAAVEEAVARDPLAVNPLVYFIQLGDRIKIGTTTSLAGRLQSMLTMASEEPKVLLAVPGGYKEEKQVHALFAEERVRGEWFEPSERLLKFIAERRDQDVRRDHLPD